jgi:acyl carrier protein
MDSSIIKQVKDVISECILMPIEEIHDNSLLGENLGMDSLDLVDVIIHLEDLLDIFIDEEYLQNILSVKDIYDVIEFHLDSKK